MFISLWVYASLHAMLTSFGKIITKMFRTTLIFLPTHCEKSAILNIRNTLLLRKKKFNNKIIFHVVTASFMQVSKFFHFLWTINSVLLDIIITIIIIDGMIHNFKIILTMSHHETVNILNFWIAANWKKTYHITR